MSIRVMTQVWELKLQDSHKFVLLAFADHANDEGVCYPSVGRIGWKCGLSVRQVQRIASDLRRAGLLEPLGGIAGGRPQGVLYRVCPRKGDKLSPFVPERGDKLSPLFAEKSDAGDVERVTSGTKGVTSPTRKGDTGVTRIIRNHQEPSGNRLARRRDANLKEEELPFMETREQQQKRKDREKLSQLQRIMRENPNLVSSEQARIQLAIDDLKRRLGEAAA